MMIDKFNEKTTVKKLMKYGFLSKKNLIYQLSLIGIYYKEKGSKESEVKKHIIEFCEKNMKGFNYIKNFNMIVNAVKAVKNKERLKEIGIMSVYKHEIDYINSVDFSLEYKKILFTFLILGKIQKEYRGNYYLNNPFSELFKRANVSTKNQYNILGDLKRAGIVNIGQRLAINCVFLENLEGVTSEDVLLVWDFEHIGWSFEQHLSPKSFIICDNPECKKIVKKSANNQKYCKDCSKIMDKIKARERMKQIRG